MDYVNLLFGANVDKSKKDLVIAKEAQLTPELRNAIVAIDRRWSMSIRYTVERYKKRYLMFNLISKGVHFWTWICCVTIAWMCTR